MIPLEIFRKKKFPPCFSGRKLPVPASRWTNIYPAELLWELQTRSIKSNVKAKTFEERWVDDERNLVQKKPDRKIVVTEKKRGEYEFFTIRSGFGRNQSHTGL